MSQCAVCLETCAGKCAALGTCGHVYHVRCISRWIEQGRTRERGRDERGRGDDATATCPTCKRAFDHRRDVVTIYLDVRRDEDVGVEGGGRELSRGRRRSTSEAGGGEAGRLADVARRLASERERSRAAEDALATVERELRECRRLEAEDAAVRDELGRLRREANAQKLARTALSRENGKLKETNDALSRRLTVLEDKERVEREISRSSASSLGEREMLKRLQGSDARTAMTTLVRNLCAKNKHMASQQEQYDALVRRIRDKESEIKTLESKVEAYRAAAKSNEQLGVAPAAPEIRARASSARAWGSEDANECTIERAGKRAGEKRAGKTRESRQPLRIGDDALMRRLAPAKPPSDEPIDLVQDDVADDVLADILNEVDERVERKRAAAATRPTGDRSTHGTKKRKIAGSFLKSSPKAPSASTTGTFIKHGADGRGGRGKFFAT